MVGIIERVNKLRQSLLSLKHGPGAAVMPADVTRIHLTFSYELYGGHMGSRKFWRNELKRLKYWNPGVPMVVNRTEGLAAPATMTIFVRKPNYTEASEPEPSTSSTSKRSKSSSTSSLQGDQATQLSSFYNQCPVPKPLASERVIKIDMKSKHSSEILSALIKATGAVIQKPAPAEQQEMEYYKTLGEQAVKDKKIQADWLKAKKKEDAIMERLKKQVAESNALAQGGKKA